MKTLFALLIMSSTALCQQPKNWEEAFRPAQSPWRGVEIDINGMAKAFAPLAYKPRSYAEYMASPDAPPNPAQSGNIQIGNQPIRIRDAQGRGIGNLSIRSNGLITVRDSRGRITSTATVRAGTINQTRTPTRTAKK